jgi:hypothetical protein
MSDYLTVQEFNIRADTFVTKEDLKAAFKEHSGDVRDMIFEAMRHSLKEAKEKFASELEYQNDKIKSLGEGIDMTREETMRLKLENIEEHTRFDRKINSLILK